MNSFSIFIFLFAVVVAGANPDLLKDVSVSVTHDNRLHVNNPFTDEYSATIEHVMVCNTRNQSQKRLDTKSGCGSEGFVQYNIDKHTHLRFPHPDRLTTPYFYAEVHLQLKHRHTGEITKDVCIVKVPVQPPTNYLALALSAVALALVIAGVITVTVIRYRQDKKIKEIPYRTRKEINEALAKQLNM